MKFLNDGRKDLRAWEKNWFFITTIVVVVLNVALYGALGGSWEQIGDYGWHWEEPFFFNNLVQNFLSNFSHSNWQHTLLNMLCFVVCGAYLERKTGSLYFFLLVSGMAFFSSACVAANDAGINFHGYSGVNYALYAYIIVDYIFMACRKKRRTKFRLISGAVMLALIYFAACFNGGTESFTFSWYPYDFCFNLGHYTSFLAGVILAIAIKGIYAVAQKNASVR